jgi:hypothetical protein
MRRRSSWKAARLIGFVCVVAASAVLAARFLYTRAESQPLPVVLSICQDRPAAGMRRINGGFGTRFDAPESEFTVPSGPNDMPTVTFHVVMRKNRATILAISAADYDNVFKDLKIAFPLFSERVEARDVSDIAGRIVGKDHWGYLKGGDPWRYVTFVWGVAVGYQPAASADARLLDRVISSACRQRIMTKASWFLFPKCGAAKLFSLRAEAVPQIFAL